MMQYHWTDYNLVKELAFINLFRIDESHIKPNQRYNSALHAKIQS